MAALEAEAFPLRPLALRRGWRLLVCGVGMERAREATRAALARFDAERVILTGTCGALAGQAVGTLLGDLEGFVPARFATVRRPVFRVQTREALRAMGFDAVEMELAGVLEAAQGRGVFSARVVSDAADTPVHPWRFRARALRLSATRLRPALGAI